MNWVTEKKTLDICGCHCVVLRLDDAKFEWGVYGSKTHFSLDYGYEATEQDARKAVQAAVKRVVKQRRPR